MQQLVCNLCFLRAQLHFLEESKSIFYRESTKLTDIASTYLDLPRFQPQPRPVAVRAQRISAITAQKDADVQLIFLALQMIEESTNSQKLPSPLRTRFLCSASRSAHGTSSGIPACLA